MGRTLNNAFVPNVGQYGVSATTVRMVRCVVATSDTPRLGERRELLLVESASLIALVVVAVLGTLVSFLLLGASVALIAAVLFGIFLAYYTYKNAG